MDNAKDTPDVDRLRLVGRLEVGGSGSARVRRVRPIAALRRLAAPPN